ncbi:hypothetical protein ACSFBF_06530 [Variovorax sp. ZT5P49]|uniref:hypothetical protein n=1 Tax=Variovorax sp. ZT5P49 TaxID=3443733 RepID=UPI003F47C2B8
MRTLVSGLFLLVVLGLGGFYFTNRQLVDANIESLTKATSPLEISLNDFSSDMTEADVRAAVDLPELRCVDERALRSMGDRTCYANIKSFHKVQALLVAFFFKEGRLSTIKIDVPNWRHTNMARALSRQYGSPTGAQDQPVAGVRLVRWDAERGRIYYNRDRELNRASWSTVYWESERKAARR